MESLDLSLVFFEALKYPSFARPNYYIEQQRISGWSKGVYLRVLREEYHGCNLRIQMHFNANQRKIPGLTREQVKLPIKEVTNGKETGVYDQKTIDDLLSAVIFASYYERERKSYTAVQTITFVEHALIFILNEFKLFIKESTDNFFRPRTESYFVYLIAQDAPFFDFANFKHAFRELLLLTSNTTGLKAILKKHQYAAKEIVRLWNTKVYNLEQAVHKSRAGISPDINRIEFHGENLKSTWWQDVPDFNAQDPNLFTNQDLASYAVRIANLISSDFLGGKEMSLKAIYLDFIPDLVSGIHKLLRNDRGTHCINDVKNGKKLEAPFRDWFSDWLEAKGYTTSREILKGVGHIDLNVQHPDIGIKIIEFKGWWNRKRKVIIQQVYNYLTQFEGDAYIVMINHTKKNIVPEYKALVATKENKYVGLSWKKITHHPTALQYFKSTHRLGPHQKEVYHFIISIW